MVAFELREDWADGGGRHGDDRHRGAFERVDVGDGDFFWQDEPGEVFEVFTGVAHDGNLFVVSGKEGDFEPVSPKEN